MKIDRQPAIDRESRMTRQLDRSYLIAIGFGLLFVMSRYFVANFFDNEWVYSLNPLKIIDPKFLSRDLFMEKVYPFFLFYDLVTIPFYYVLGPFGAVLVLRLIIWSFQLWALSRLARTLGITWWGFIVLLITWLNVEQTLVAGEWVIRSANAKPIAYGFLFLALDSVLRKKQYHAGAFSGLAISFHVLVGFWSLLALGLALLMTSAKEWEFKQVLQTLAVAFLFALPGLLPPLYGEFLSKSTPMTQSASAGEVSRLSVLLANPFHLDPKHFMTGLEHLKVALFAVLALLLMRYQLPAEHARVMTLFILFLLLFFLSGLVARAAEWYQYLKYYPFRVADGFLPLSFWMGAVILFQNAVTRYANKTIVLVLMVPLTIGTANYLIELCEPSPRYELSFSSYAQAMAKTEPRTTAYNVRERGKEWHALFAREWRSDIEEMEAWIRKNTPKDSVFINLPWSVSFSLNAQRAEFAAAIKPPPTDRIIEWKQRIELLNRGPLRSVGFGVFKELRKNFPLLTEEEVREIKCRYDVDYFLTNSLNAYSFPLAHKNESYHLYALNNRSCR